MENTNLEKESDMNTTTKTAIGALLGAGIGWFVGSVIVEYIHMKEEEFYRDAEYDESEEMPEGDEADKMEKDQRPVEMSKKSKKVKAKTVDYTKLYVVDEGKEDLKKLVQKYNHGIISEDETVGATEGEAWVDEDAETAEPEEPIQIISLADYANSDTGYEQHELNYFSDDVVTDENLVPIANPEQLIGEEALVSFGVLSENEDVVYIRNETIKAEYEITRLYREFAQRAVDSRRPRRVTKEKDDEGEEDS